MFDMSFMSDTYLHMELRDLDIFLAVVRTRSFTRAAEQTYLTQPAVSLAVQRLEAELGTQLVERRRGEARTTDAGAVLLEHATAIAAHRESIRWELGQAGRLEGGELRLGTTDAVSVYLLPAVYREFRERHPRVGFRVSVDSSRVLARGLRTGELDLAVLTLPAPDRALDTEELETERLVMVIAPTHALAVRRRIRAPALTELAMIGYPTGSVTRGTIDRALADAGVDARVTMEMGSPEAMKRLVEVGLGYAVLPEALVAEEVAEGRLARIPLVGFRATRTLGFATASGRPVSPAARAFRELATEHLAERAKRMRTLRNARGARRRSSRPKR